MYQEILLMKDIRFFFLQFVELGVVTSIEYNHKPVESARKGQEVCLKIEPIPGEAPKMFGRHFDEKDFVVSKVGSFNFIVRPRERVKQRFTRHHGQLLNPGNIIPCSSSMLITVLLIVSCPTF